MQAGRERWSLRLWAKGWVQAAGASGRSIFAKKKPGRFLSVLVFEKVAGPQTRPWGSLIPEDLYVQVGAR